MKKILSILLVAVMIFSISACSGNKQTEKASDTFKNINTDTADIEAPETYSAAESETAESDSSPFSKIATEAPDIKAPEKVTVSDARINFEVTAPKIDAVKPVKPAEAKFEFEVADFDLNLSANLTNYDEAKIASLSTEEKKIILEKKSAILTSLATAFGKNNINVTINEISGEIIMDSSILFANDDSTVSKAGKQLIEKFIEVYASIVCDDEYDDFISGIVVEGHTDTNGTYDYNKKLSAKRAVNVKNVCLSDNIDVTDAAMNSLKNKLSSVGCSYDRPIKNSDGSVNMDASRRVSFRFLINLD